jgi:hypothetical protein
MGAAELFWPMIAVISTASFSFVAVIIWLAFRAKEREEYYRHETTKKIVESGTSTAALDYLRETDRIMLQRLRGGIRLGGLVTVAVGIGLMVSLRAIVEGSGIYLVALIPLLVGVVLFTYAQFMMPGDGDPGSSRGRTTQPPNS